MRLVTFSSSDGPRLGLQISSHIVDLPAAHGAMVRTAEGARDGLAGRAFPETLIELLQAGDGGMTAAREVAAFASSDRTLQALTTLGLAQPEEKARFLPPIVRPGKIICLGLNYKLHVQEMGRELPEYPTLFAKFATALVGHRQPIVLPTVSRMVDYEAELAIVIGRVARNVSKERALEYVAGYTIFNDVAVRDYQRRTPQWLQGKTFDATSPVGPALVTPDEAGHGPREVSLRLNGVVMQQASTSDFIFEVATLVHYLAQIMTLEPGDIIATGTPGGVGFARDPQVFLTAGDTVRIEIGGVGVLENPVVEASG